MFSTFSVSLSTNCIVNVSKIIQKIVLLFFKNKSFKIFKCFGKIKKLHKFVRNKEREREKILNRM